MYGFSPPNDFVLLFPYTPTGNAPPVPDAVSAEEVYVLEGGVGQLIIELPRKTMVRKGKKAFGQSVP